LVLPTLFVFGFLCAGDGQAQALPERVKLCESCHGPDGNSVTAKVPSIAAQPPVFLENSLVYFREDLRKSPVMQGIATGMKDEDITALARHFSARKATVATTTPPDAQRMKRGAEAAARLHCGQCHLARFQGQGQIARLAGQREDYLLDALRGYRDGTRSAADTTMTEVLHGVDDADLDALAHYMAHVE
jgi:cytochrome c553